MLSVFMFSTMDKKTIYMVFAADRADADAQMLEQIDEEELDLFDCTDYGKPDAPGFRVIAFST